MNLAPSGVGGIEAEAVMLGQPISMVLPEVVGYKVHGAADKLITSTDIVLTVTKVGSSWMQLFQQQVLSITDVSFLHVLAAPPSGGRRREIRGVLRPRRGSAVDR